MTFSVRQQAARSTPAATHRVSGTTGPSETPAMRDRHETCGPWMVRIIAIVAIVR